MGNGLILRRLHLVHIGRVLSFLGILTVLALFYLFVNPYVNYLSVLSYTNGGLVFTSNDGKRSSHNSTLAESDFMNNHIQNASSLHDMRQRDLEFEDDHVGSNISAETGPYGTAINISTGKLGKSNLSTELDLSLVYNNKHKLFKDRSNLINGVSADISAMAINTSLRKRGGKATSIVQMTSLLLQNRSGTKSKRHWLSSQRDREIQAAKFQIENAPIQRGISGLHSSLFRNYSMFKRSYELMETTLKVYVYKEGEKPVFHMPYMRGIYASEGWFMKLMERNKKFVAKDPKKAHLFYLPFSSVKLRNALNGSGFVTQKDLENHLKKYVDTIASKYRFWKRRGGADHFLVACHDWAPRFTRTVFGSSIRVLCNSNLARGFQIGKDVSLPVTYIRSAENPLRDIGGNPPSNRSILAFFAGGMHGYVRPLLLQHWHNKVPDMKILGPMSRDIEGKAMYREFMKSSKYCICAKGYEVHTPRVVESIYYECVPVIISDNYVPPFFEVLDWESFALFVLEKDIPRLRDILMSIPEDRYAMMHQRLKMVQRYFLWHKVPERYDLFHMTLHSIWYNRVYNINI